jgi:hypothetical protein
MPPFSEITTARVSVLLLFDSPQNERQVQSISMSVLYRNHLTHHRPQKIGQIGPVTLERSQSYQRLAEA